MLLSKLFESQKGRHVWPTRSICEVHRQIYDLIVLECPDGLADKLIPLLEEAYIDGVKMTKKLVEYKCSLPQWKKNDMQEAQRLRKLRIHLEKQLEAGARLRQE